MNTPIRYCIRNNPGWKKPDGCLYVGNTGRAPSPWGNPYKVNRAGKWRSAVSPRDEKFPKEYDCKTHAEACWRYRELLARSMEQTKLDEIRCEIRGRDIFCWCRVNQPCHGDILMFIANSDDSLEEVRRKLADPTEYLKPDWPNEPPPLPTFEPMIYRIRVNDHMARVRLLQWLARWQQIGSRVESLGPEGEERPLPPSLAPLVEQWRKPIA